MHSSILKNGEYTYLDPYVHIPRKRVGTPMTQEEKDKLFDEAAQIVAGTLKKKNHDYGDSFHEQFKKFGHISSLIRLSDKLGRLEKLTRIGEDNAKVQESIEDTYLDMAGYAILSYTSIIRLRQEG